MTRRRKTIWLLLLAMSTIMLFAHWYFTQGVDQRLVGTWSVTSTSPQRPRSHIWRFGPYGRAAICEKQTILLRFSWKVRGTTVECSSMNHRQTFAPWIKREWELLWGKITGQSPDYWTEYYEIVDIGPDEISLKYLENNEQITLRRLSEGPSP